MSAVRAWRYGRGAGVQVSVLAIVSAAALLVGCLVDSTPSSSSSGSGPAPQYSSGGAAGSSGSAAAPELVYVDANQTLESTPGQGIGVYVEYETGGHWRISWTCDTGLTHLSCNFVVDASAATGTIANPAATAFESSDSLTEPSPQQIEATTTTTTGIDAVVFDTTPGARITVNVQLNAPVSFFFVQDGKVNGGYQGPLTNPLMFEPSTP